MKKLNELFDRVYIINCAHRPDRKERVIKHLEEDGLLDPGSYIVYPAIIGDWTSCPEDWKSGRGAWGCLRSHQRILEDVMHTRDDRDQLDVESVLIMEDDVVFLENALEDTNEFMGKVPSDWGQIYLGGQHRRKPEQTEVEGVIRGMSVNRTHCYAVHRSVIQPFYRHVCYASDYRDTNKHIDHQLELAHNRKDWNVYCPSKWVCGQEEGASNVSGKILGRQIWQHGD